MELEKEEEAIIVPMAAAERSVRGFWRIYARLCLRTVRITHVDRWTYRARRKVVPPRKRVDRFSCSPYSYSQQELLSVGTASQRKRIKGPINDRRSGVWVWAYRKNGPGPGRAKPIQT